MIISIKGYVNSMFTNQSYEWVFKSYLNSLLQKIISFRMLCQKLISFRMLRNFIDVTRVESNGKNHQGSSKNHKIEMSASITILTNSAEPNHIRLSYNIITSNTF